MMSEMVERVAKAIAAASLDEDELPVSDRLLEVAYFPLARAAIEAMREPTEAMVCAAMIQPYPGVSEAGGLIPQAQAAVRIEWQAMIDEALK